MNSCLQQTLHSIITSSTNRFRYSLRIHRLYVHLSDSTSKLLMKDVNAAGRIENWTSKSVAYVRSDYLDFDNVL